ncbi:MAG: hypothetical protein M0025_12390 [Elusimicrobia bacterium]|nr:hypothetical protein [Elusimicrobiota bacterium]
MKKAILAAILVLACGFGAEAADRLAGSPVYSDPAFQDFVETSYGYLNPANSPARFRDSVASRSSSAVAEAGRGGYVFVAVLPGQADRRELLERLRASAGFVFRGERVSGKGKARSVRLLGWVRSGELAALRAVPGVARVSVRGGKTAL